MALKCPCCHSKVVWLFALPDRGDYACVKCGHTWRRELEETAGQFGMFLGDWTEEEKKQLEREVLSVCTNPKVTDWFFFKGRKIFTAWCASDHTKLIRTRVIGGTDGLAWWIGCAIVNPKWYGHYQKACVDRTALAV